MKSRYINTKFWSDPFVGELSPEEKLVFLYFLTNEHTNISGIYELSLRNAAFETGLEQYRIEEILQKLDNKIIYYNGYVIAKNFYKHQQKNAKINIGISTHLRELPVKVITKLNEINFPVKELIDRGLSEENNFAMRRKNRQSTTNGFHRAFEND